jgi:hypothetical protein
VAVAVKEVVEEEVMEVVEEGVTEVTEATEVVLAMVTWVAPAS